MGFLYVIHPANLRGKYQLSCPSLDLSLTEFPQHKSKSHFQMKTRFFPFWSSLSSYIDVIWRNMYILLLFHFPLFNCTLKKQGVNGKEMSWQIRSLPLPCLSNELEGSEPFKIRCLDSVHRIMFDFYNKIHPFHSASHARLHPSGKNQLKGFCVMKHRHFFFNYCTQLKAMLFCDWLTWICYNSIATQNSTALAVFITLNCYGSACAESDSKYNESY